MHDSDPERSALPEENGSDELRRDVVARREAVSLRVTNARQSIIAGVAVACCGLTLFIDVAAPLPNVISSESLSGSAPSAAMDVGVAVSGAS